MVLMTTVMLLRASGSLMTAAMLLIVLMEVWETAAQATTNVVEGKETVIPMTTAFMV